MDKKYDCLRCGPRMNYAFTEDVQLGRTSFLFGDWPNLIAGAMHLEIYCCPKCGKVEFFAADNDPEAVSPGTPQVKCPVCGKQHDFDYPRCPFCKHTY